MRELRRRAYRGPRCIYCGARLDAGRVCAAHRSAAAADPLIVAASLPPSPAWRTPTQDAMPP